MPPERTDDLFLQILFFGSILIVVGIYVMFLFTLRSTIKLIRPQNRSIAPNRIWLMLIPFFNLLYQFVVVFQTVQSIRFEFKSRQIIIRHRVMLYTGNIACILNFLGLFSENMALGGIVFSVLFWLLALMYRNKLSQLQKEPSGWDFDKKKGKENVVMNVSDTV